MSRWRVCRSGGAAAAAHVSSSRAPAAGPHGPQPRPRRVIRALHLEPGHHGVPAQPAGGADVRDDGRELGDGGLQEAELAVAVVVVVAAGVVFVGGGRARPLLLAPRALLRRRRSGSRSGPIGGRRRSSPVLVPPSPASSAPVPAAAAAVNGVQDRAGVPAQRRQHALDGPDDESRRAASQARRRGRDPGDDERREGQGEDRGPAVGAGGVEGGRGGHGAGGGGRGGRGGPDGGGEVDVGRPVRQRAQRPRAIEGLAPDRHDLGHHERLLRRVLAAVEEGEEAVDLGLEGPARERGGGRVPKRR